MKTSSAARGLSILELVVGLAILAVAFVLLLDVFHVFASGMKVESVNSDQNTRVRGTLYDIGSELRQATACSPNFYIEQRTNIAPSVTFDLIDTVDSNGQYVWGSKITYRLAAAPLPDTTVTDMSGVVRAQLIRDELKKTGETITSVVEDNVPLQFSNGAAVKWGFTAARTGSALAITLSRFADSGVNTADTVNPLGPGGTPKHSVVITTATTVYYLRNPQAVLTLQ